MVVGTVVVGTVVVVVGTVVVVVVVVVGTVVVVLVVVVVGIVVVVVTGTIVVVVVETIVVVEVGAVMKTLGKKNISARGEDPATLCADTPTVHSLFILPVYISVSEAMSNFKLSIVIV